MPADVRVRSFLLFIYFSAGNGGSGTYPAQRLATSLPANAKDRHNVQTSALASLKLNNPSRNFITN